MEVVNLCKLLPGSCGHQVPGRDCQDWTVAARNNTSHRKSPGCCRCCYVHPGMKQPWKASAQLDMRKFYSPCFTSTLRVPQLSPPTAKPLASPCGLHWLLKITGRKKQIHKAHPGSDRGRITTLGSCSLWRAQSMRTNDLTLLSYLLPQPATTLLVLGEGWMPVKRGRE